MGGLADVPQIMRNAINAFLDGARSEKARTSRRSMMFTATSSSTQKTMTICASYWRNRAICRFGKSRRNRTRGNMLSIYWVMRRWPALKSIVGP